MNDIELCWKEECLRQRSRILEQIRELKRIDVGQGRKLHICKKMCENLAQFLFFTRHLFSFIYAFFWRYNAL